jgi:uncharacterized membrane protein
MPDRIESYMDQLGTCLHVHPSRRERVLAELRSHLRESAETHGEEEAIRRTGTPAEVARSFTPSLAHRLWEERDRLSALALIAAILASLPMAADLLALNDRVGVSTLGAALLLAPSAAVAAASSILVLLRRPAGALLAGLLVIMVAATAVITLAGLPPMGDVLDGYAAATRLGYETGGCDGRTLTSCAADHESEVRLSFSAAAVLLSLAHLAAVTGWTPRRPARRRTSPA